MADLPAPQSGVVTLRRPIAIGGELSDAIFCSRWLFQTAEDLAIAPWQPRGPSVSAWFAVAAGEPVNDPEKPGTLRAPLLALIPSENVLGFAACNKAPPKTLRVDSEAAPA